MESTIIRTSTVNKMSKMFDTMYDQINIRFYEPLNESLQITDFDKPIKFRIRIRHCENEKAEEVYKNAIKKLTKGKNHENLQISE